MKTIKTFSLLIMVLGLLQTGCDREELVQRSLPGEWGEVFPEADRTILIFSDQNTMTRVDAMGNSEEYTYELDKDSIHLKSISDTQGTTTLYFNKIEPGRFKIGNLYPSIPEAEPIHMLFEKF